MVWARSRKFVDGEPVEEGKLFPSLVRVRDGSVEVDRDKDGSSLSCLKEVGGADDSLEVAAAAKEGPKTFSNEWLLGGAAGDVYGEGLGTSTELSCRRKKGLFALMVERAGLATWGGLRILEAAAAASSFLSSSMLFVNSVSSDFSFSRSPSLVASCFLLIATRPFC